ncbi:MAG: hypothetical protein WB729_05115 [Candidatus Sulfotelmatobacter sp.]
MLSAALVFIFFVLLAIGRELHTITSRLIEIGTIVEHFNRRDLRASGINDVDGADFASESVTKTHQSWTGIVVGIVIEGLAFIVVFKLLSRLGW